LDAVTRITGASLDSSSTRQMNSHPPVLVLKSARGTANNPKPNIVVPIVRVVPVAIGRTAVPRIVVPRTTAQQPEVLTPFFACN
jgi:hypothetical protein